MCGHSWLKTCDADFIIEGSDIYKGKVKKNLREKKLVNRCYIDYHFLISQPIEVFISIPL